MRCLSSSPESHRFALYPIMAGGIVTICVGVGLLIEAKVLADARERERIAKSAP